MKTSETYFALASDGLLYNLGNHGDYEAANDTAENLGLAVVWLFGEDSARDWRDTLAHHLGASMEYTYHQDPGHGWIEVPIEELHRLKITPSAYSYRKGETAYLEEDCDAGAWARAKRLAGEAFTLLDMHTNHDHPIRTYQPFGA